VSDLASTPKGHGALIVLTFYPGERAKCPARVSRGHGTERCGRDLGLYASDRTIIVVRVATGDLKPGEMVRQCARCSTRLGIRSGSAEVPNVLN